MIKHAVILLNSPFNLLLNLLYIRSVFRGGCQGVARGLLGGFEGSDPLNPLATLKKSSGNALKTENESKTNIRRSKEESDKLRVFLINLTKSIPILSAQQQSRPFVELNKLLYIRSEGGLYYYKF